jgi:hypothetical protein
LFGLRLAAERARRTELFSAACHTRLERAPISIKVPNANEFIDPTKIGSGMKGEIFDNRLGGYRSRKLIIKLMGLQTPPELVLAQAFLVTYSV